MSLFARAFLWFSVTFWLYCRQLAYYRLDYLTMSAVNVCIQCCVRPTGLRLLSRR